LIEAGYTEHAARGQPFARFLTVTWPTDVGALIHNADDCAATSARFARFVQEIRRTHQPRIEYYQVKEATKRGRLHVHALTFGPWLRKCRRTLPGGCVLDCPPPCPNPCHRAQGCQAHPGREPCIQAIAHRLGLGWVDVRRVRGQRHAANYIAKYLGKDHVGRRWPRYSRRSSYSRRFAPTTIGQLAEAWSRRAYEAGVAAGHIIPEAFAAAEHTRWRLLTDLIRRGPPVAWIDGGWILDPDAGTMRLRGGTLTADLDTGEIIEEPNVALSETAVMRRHNRRIEQAAAAIAGPGWPDDPVFADPTLRRLIYTQARRRAHPNP
jgi:hypothetical protein